MGKELFELVLSVYKYRNAGYTYAREFRMETEPEFMGRKVSKHDLRFMFSKGKYRLKYQQKSNGTDYYVVIPGKKVSGYE